MQDLNTAAVKSQPILCILGSSKILPFIAPVKSSYTSTSISHIYHTLLICTQFEDGVIIAILIRMAFFRSSFSPFLRVM